jgi:hypothetical protein
MSILQYILLKSKVLFLIKLEFITPTNIPDPLNKNATTV